MWNRFYNWIKSKLSKPETPVVITPSVPRPYESTTGKSIAVCLGHSFTGSDKGAYGNGTNEVEYNSWVMDYLQLQGLLNVSFHKGRNSVTAALSAVGADIIIQLHLNAYNGSAKGCEVLAIKNDTKSYPLAEKFVKDFTERFDRVMRRSDTQGKKLLSSRDRGVSSLVACGDCEKILVEPFFIDNPKDFVPKEEYAEFLLDFIKGL